MRYAVWLNGNTEDVLFKGRRFEPWYILEWAASSKRLSPVH